MSRREQRRRKSGNRRLSERQRKQHMPKNVIASVVHDAVCEFFGDDGCGHCAHYAVAGSKLVSSLSGQLYLPQAGDLWVMCDGDAGMMMDASQGGVRTGEFHAWIIGPCKVGTGQPGGLRPFEAGITIIDFSARHLNKLVERLGYIDTCEPGASKPLWQLPPPPTFIWCEIDGLPDWFRVSSNAESTTALLDHLNEFEPLMRLVMEKWRGRTR